MFYKKCQGAIEFVILIGTASFMAIIFILNSAYQLNQFNDAKEHPMMIEVASMIQSEVYLAANAEDGYEREFYIPPLIDNTINYTALVEGNDTIVVYSDRFTYLRKVPIVIGQLLKEENVIKKNGGGIYLN
jgi:hypothetical protein